MSTAIFRALVALSGVKVALSLLAWAAGLLTHVEGSRLPLWGGNIVTSLLFVGMFTIVGSVLLADASRGPQSRRLGLFLLVSAGPFANVLARNGHTLGGAAALTTALHLEAALPVTLWWFVRAFPRGVDAPGPEPRDSVTDILALGSIVVASILLDRIPAGLVASVYWPIVFLAMLPVIPVLAARTRRASPSERRRVQLFTAALTLGPLPLTLDVILRTVSPGWNALVSNPDVNRVVTTTAIGGLLTVPVTTAYAVTVARVFDFRLAAKSVVHYALARTTLTIFVLAPAAVLVRVGYENRNQTVAALFSGGTGGASLVVLVGAVAALAFRGTLVARIDAHFFRESVAPDAVLVEALAVCREAASDAALSASIEQLVRERLHAASAVFLSREARSGTFGPRAGDVTPLRADSALLRVLSASDLPLVVTDTHEHAIVNRLDEWTRQWLPTTGAALLIPARSVDAQLLGFFAIGPKRSELEYSRTEHQVLAAIGNAVGLALQRLAEQQPYTPPLPADGVFSDDIPGRECPDCGLVHSATAVFCRCGTLLEESELPQDLLGKYRVERRIGRGGMGVVYRATDRVLLRIVAIKTLPRSGPEHIGRLKREAQAMARVNHPHLATIHGIEFWRQRPCLVVEWLEAGTLADRLSRGPMPYAELLRLGRQMSEALIALHELGILHRDVKPSNIGFTQKGTAKLLDFGLAKPGLPLADGDLEERGRNATLSGALLGTPAYLPPEAFDGAAPSTGFDLWGLSVVLLEAATGTNPFQGTTFADTFERVREGLDRERHVPPALGPLGELLARALDRAPATRPGSAAAYLAQLNAHDSQDFPAA